MSQVKEPEFKIIRQASPIEVREYSPVITAQVLVSGDRKTAISAGFKLLADYIFGNNKAQQKISMTAPVLQQQGEKISMTAPVLQQETTTDGQWLISFVMPAEYTLKTLPEPVNHQVKIVSVPAKRYAVIVFSGLAREDTLKQNLEMLRTYLTAEKLQSVGGPMYAFYNPPWTLPFLRRNEIMIEVKNDLSSQ